MAKGFQSNTGYARWRVAPDCVLNMCDMSESHLVNCYKLCVERNDTAKAREILEHLHFRRKGQVPDKPFDQGDW